MPPAGPCWPSAPVLAPTPICQKKEHDLPDKKTSVTVRSSFTHARTDPQEAQTHMRTHTHKPTEKSNCAHARTHICVQQLLGHAPCAQVALHKRFAQLALRKLRCGKCSAQVALRELRCGSCSASCSAQAALRKLLGASCSAQVLQLELQEYTPRTTLVILELEVRECTPRTTFALKFCDFQLELRAARAAADQAGIAPATARHRRAAAQTTRQLPKTNSQAKSAPKKKGENSQGLRALLLRSAARKSDFGLPLRRERGTAASSPSRASNHSRDGGPGAGLARPGAGLVRAWRGLPGLAPKPKPPGLAPKPKLPTRPRSKPKPHSRPRFQVVKRSRLH